MVIRVSGYPGSGKTTLSKRLAETLGYEYHYAGSLFRTMAAERGQSIEEFYAALAATPDLENDIDKKQEEIMATHDNLIMEGRVAPFLSCPFPTCNVLLLVSKEESARRGLGRPENAGRSMEEMMYQTEERVATERAHYKQLHGIVDHFDPVHFDIVVDTTNTPPEGVYEKVLSQIKWLAPDL